MAHNIVGNLLSQLICVLITTLFHKWPTCNIKFTYNTDKKHNLNEVESVSTHVIRKHQSKSVKAYITVKPV